MFAMARQTVAQWIKTHVQKLPESKDLLLPAKSGDVLELDEIWNCVFKKVHTRWLWTASQSDEYHF
jgi:hypothetical protein